ILIFCNHRSDTSEYCLASATFFGSNGAGRFAIGALQESSRFDFCEAIGRLLDQLHKIPQAFCNGLCRISTAMAIDTVESFAVLGTSPSFDGLPGFIRQPSSFA